jgi:hypothetical protein
LTSASRQMRPMIPAETVYPTSLHLEQIISSSNICIFEMTSTEQNIKKRKTKETVCTFQRGMHY